jgi:hypothetical protein
MVYGTTSGWSEPNISQTKAWSSTIYACIKNLNLILNFFEF